MKKIVVLAVALGVAVSAFGANPPSRIAVILPTKGRGGTRLAADIADDVMIGVNRAAREFAGFIDGREGKIDYGDAVEFAVLETPDDSSKIERALPRLGLEKYDLVIGAGFLFGLPFEAIHRDYPGTTFVVVDYYADLSESGGNLLALRFQTRDAAFVAGALAADRFAGKTLGMIVGMDIPFMWEEFIDGFVEGAAYMDDVAGTTSPVAVEFVGDFGDYDAAYDLATRMYRGGIPCIYQTAGDAGYGVLDAARDHGRWVIGVDTDQGLETALRGEASNHILTSTVKRWGNGVYLVVREFLEEGSLPRGVRVVGIPEGCAEVAVNPYNAPIIADQLDLMASLRAGLIAGKLPAAAPSGGEVWRAKADIPDIEIVTVTVNDPILAPGIPEHYGPAIQEALSTEFHGIGLYRVIDKDQVDRLLEEISFSLEGVTEENQSLEIGRLAAAEAIVFVSVGDIAGQVNIDCKLVDVETGLTIAASRESYADFQKLFENLDDIVGALGR